MIKKLKKLDWSPKGQWKWTLTGWTIAGVIGSGIIYPLYGFVVFGAIGGIIGWSLRFYDENFSNKS